MPQLNIRIPDEALAAIDAAIRRIDQTDDPIGQRSDYVRTAATVAAMVETQKRPLNVIVGRYLEICRRERPPLKPGEWRVIMDACNGLWLSDQIAVVAIPLEVRDYLRIDREGRIDISLPTKADDWGLTREEQDSLPKRLEALGYAGLCAVANVIEIFWGDTENNAVPGESGWTEPPFPKLV